MSQKKHRFVVLAVGSVLVLAGAGCNQAAPVASTGKAPMQPVAQPATNDTTPVPAPTITVDINGSQTAPVMATEDVKEFTVTAKSWAFDPGTITVHKGDKVRLKITSVDVTHGFKLEDFNVKLNLEPGKTQIVEFVADKAGTFSFFCSVYCGEGHRQMKGQLVVEE